MSEADRAGQFMTELLDEWSFARARLAALEAAEHPDIIDRFGRAWQWRGRGDLYSHDDTLAFPADWVRDPNLGLPSPSLVDNPNYSRLCDTCRRAWPSGQEVEERAA